MVKHIKLENHTQRMNDLKLQKFFGMLYGCIENLHTIQYLEEQFQLMT